MSIVIKLSDKQVFCTFDKCGNIYFADASNPNDLYDLTITNTNELLLEKYIPTEYTDEKPVYIGELVPFYNNATLRDKAIKSKQESQYDDEYNSEDEMEIDDDTIQKYYNENLEFNEYSNKDRKDPFFSFNITSQTNLENKLVFDRDSVNALYDTLVYNGNLEMCNLIMKTSLVNDMALYRLCVFTSGDIKFRAIGSPEIYYKINYDNEQLNLTRVK